MKPLFCASWAGVVLLLALVSPALSNEEGELRCHNSGLFLAPPPAESPDYRKYAPGREVFIKHLALDVTPDFRERTVHGTATLTFKVHAAPVRELRLDAVDLNIVRVESSEPLEAWHAGADHLTLTFAKLLPAQHEGTVTVEYSAEPREGLYFRTPEMGYKSGETHLFTQGEQIEARHWYPVLDAPNQLFTSEIMCRVPEGMTVVSNGRLISQSTDAATGLVKFHWAQEKPHVNYLITLVAGYFKKLEDKYRDIPLAFYTLPSEFAYASNSFHNTKAMLEFFEKEIGVPYPWNKYYQICVNDFVAGGMENTSATTLTDRTLFSSDTGNIRDSEGLVAHELAHQWFGNLVTCKDWSHIWLNEGFATYYESLWTAHSRGRDEMLYELYRRARSLTAVANDPTPIVRRTFNDPGEMFDRLAYPKGGWVLHMLRAQLGEKLYRQAIQQYLERYQHGNVVTDNLRAVLEEVSGQSLDRFFDQWLYHGHHPELQVAYNWDQSAKLAKISLRQVQPVSEKILLFQFPVTVRFKGAFGTVDFSIQVSRKEEDFYCQLPAVPDLVRFDPDYTLLAKISFELPRPMLYAQLNESGDVIGRLIALDQLAKRQDRETIRRLKETLNQDGFYGVRIEAAKALRSIRTPEALEVLLASTEQSDARVRLQVFQALGGFYDPKAYDALRGALRRERNPAIIGAILPALAAYDRPEVSNTLLEYLNSESFRNELAEAAIDAIRAQGDPDFIGLLLETMSRRGTDFGTRGFTRGMDTLAWLARNEEHKDNVRDFLVRQVNHPKQRVRAAALSALGTLGDPAALPVLQTFINPGRETPESRAATAAQSELRSRRKPDDELKTFRQEVLDLQKANRELQKKVEDLDRKFSAKPPPAPEPKRPAARLRTPKTAPAP